MFHSLNCFFSYLHVDCHRTWFMTLQLCILRPCTLLSFVFVYLVAACVLEKIMLAVFLLASIFFGSLLGCFPTWITSDLHCFLFTSLQSSSQLFACTLDALFVGGFFFNTCIRTASLLFYVLICSLPFLMWEVRPVLWRKNSNFECVGAESWGQYLDHGNKKLWVDGENYTIWSVTRFNLRIFLFEWLNQKLKAKKCNTLGTGEKIRVIFRPKTPETWIRLQRLPGRTCGLREHGNHSSNSGRSTDICLLRCCVVRLCDGLIARPVST